MEDVNPIVKHIECHGHVVDSRSFMLFAVENNQSMKCAWTLPLGSFDRYRYGL
jgi:hypothetical protein